MDCYCVDCGEYTTRRGPFGGLLCAECHESQDDAVESYEKVQAKKFGYADRFKSSIHDQLTS